MPGHIFFFHLPRAVPAEANAGKAEQVVEVGRVALNGWDAKSDSGNGDRPTVERGMVALATVQVGFFP